MPEGNSRQLLITRVLLSLWQVAVPMTSSEKQAAHRERLRAQGKTQKLVTVEAAAWQSGYEAGMAVLPDYPPPAGIDRLSWFSRYIEGKAHRGH